MPQTTENMSNLTRQEAMIAVGEAFDELRKANAPLTEASASVLQHWFLSGVQWGLDHAFMEKSRLILPN